MTDPVVTMDGHTYERSAIEVDLLFLPNIFTLSNVVITVLARDEGYLTHYE